MAWTRIDDKFYDNVKIQRVGAIAAHLYIAGLVHCNSKLTDGFIDESLIVTFAGKAFSGSKTRNLIQILIDNDLWDKVEGGYQIHDFLDYNRSKKQIEALNKKRAEAGATGGKAGKQNVSKTEAKQEAKQEAKAEQSDTHNIPNIPYYPNHSLQNDLTTTRAAAVFSAYESEIGMLTGMVRELIVSAIEDYPEEWIVAAIHEAATNNKRNWKYCEAILKRWKVDGFQVDTKKRGGNGHKSKSPDMGGYEVDRTSEVVIVDNGEVFDGELQF